MLCLLPNHWHACCRQTRYLIQLLPPTTLMRCSNYRSQTLLCAFWQNECFILGPHSLPSACELIPRQIAPASNEYPFARPDGRIHSSPHNAYPFHIREAQPLFCDPLFRHLDDQCRSLLAQYLLTQCIKRSLQGDRRVRLNES